MKPETIRVANSYNILPTIAMSLIVCYYAFESINESDFLPNKVQLVEPNDDFAMFEMNIQKFRTAIILHEDAVELNGLLYQVEKSLLRLNLNNKWVEISNIQAMISASRHDEAIRLTNLLHDTVLRDTRQ